MTYVIFLFQALLFSGCLCRVFAWSGQASSVFSYWFVFEL